MYRVAVQLLTYNGERFIAEAIESLNRQTFTDFTLYVLDNASTDGSLIATEKALATFSRSQKSGKEEKNIGFTGGHNKLFATHDAEYVLCMNQDVVLEPDFLEKLVRVMDAHPEAGSVSGRLQRFGEAGAPLIDTAGLTISASRSVRDIGAGEPDAGQYDGLREVFGVSGALPLYRRTAVIDVSPDGTFFDPTYFAYKEDVDLAWRLRLRGWKSFVAGDALARHARSAKPHARKSDFVVRSSFRNQLLMLLKNHSGFSGMSSIVGHELTKFGYLLVTRPRALAGLGDVFRLLPETLKSRKFVQSRRTHSVREWIN